MLSETERIRNFNKLRAVKDISDSTCFSKKEIYIKFGGLD